MTQPWTNNPTEQISYVSCHDDMCLVDRLKASIASLTDKNIPEAIRTAELLRIDQLAQTCVFTSQGVPFILAGEEMLRDKKEYTIAIILLTASTSLPGPICRSIRRRLLITRV